MEIIQQRIVWREGKIQILYLTHYGYFISSNGAFGQRDSYIEPIHVEQVELILSETQKHFNIPKNQM